MPEITVKLGDQTVQTCTFGGELLRIGRSRENDVVLENLSVSRQHVQIRQHEGRFILTDLNSANGTLVNGVRVTKTEVVDDDIITIGKHKLYFRNQPQPVLPNVDDPSAEQRTVMVEPRTEAWLQVESGRLKGREFKITRFETSLGKAASNDVVLTDDWLLGKKQAIILRKGNHGFEIQDLGGLRRVKVNGAAVAERAELKNGDRIELGGTILVFNAPEVQAKPTGRVPSEIKSDTPAPPDVRMPAFDRPLTPEPAEAPRHMFNSLDNDSLDLEEGYHNLKVTLTKQQAAAPPPTEEVEPKLEPEPTPVEEETAAHPAPVEAVPVMAVQNGHINGSIDRNGAAISYNGTNGSLSSQRNVFDDPRSSGRRKRKHHQRAAQKQDGSGVTAKAASATSSKKQLPADEKPTAPYQVLPGDKEIEIWEAALTNASPAIRRQAARELKKLTGRDYEV